MSELDPDVRDKLLTLWEALGSPESSEIPPEALAAAGISQADYAAWRLDLEDEKTREKEIRDDAALRAAMDDQIRAGGDEPLPPKHTSEESAAVERREREAEDRAKRARERESKAEWEDEDA